MSRRSLSARVDALEHRGAELAGELVAPAHVHPVHAATIEVMAELLSLGNELAGPETPAMLRAMMRTLDRARPLLVEQIAEIPPAQIREFMGHLAERMQRIVTSDDDDQAGDGDRPLADLA